MVPAIALADFERMALERNPTLRQATAQFEAALHRSRQAGLYPNPTLGYIQDQIGSFSESQPTSNGFAVKGKPSPGDNVGAYVQWQIVTAGKLRLSRAKFAEEATAAHWQAIGQELRVLNGVRIQYLEVIAAERLIAIHREMVKLDGDAVRTMEEMLNVGQVSQPEVIQAQVQSAVPGWRFKRRRIVFGAIGKSSSRSRQHRAATRAARQAFARGRGCAIAVRRHARRAASKQP